MRYGKRKHEPEKNPGKRSFCKTHFAKKTNSIFRTHFSPILKMKPHYYFISFSSFFPGARCPVPSPSFTAPKTSSLLLSSSLGGALVTGAVLSPGTLWEAPLKAMLAKIIFGEYDDRFIRLRPCRQ
ncbi:hypothetical protein GQ43DRAFT_310636 [Delitschia confertaspora ATCC 74209]|uniref:Uncharacterized protein n=1 Tax=Delitschia confertaspora ATCC 74209 TaxID=1513339 RepID=A0A9P4MTX3_9PLEO|nr:hypothetical protein GQ43DRAFT_310636 [Delitschia confertaspora ATCC 74209]